MSAPLASCTESRCPRLCSSVRARFSYGTRVDSGRLRLAHGSLDTLPLSDAALNAAITVNRLYFVADLDSACHELARVTDGDGTLVLGIGDPEAMLRIPRRGMDSGYDQWTKSQRPCATPASQKSTTNGWSSPSRTTSSSVGDTETSSATRSTSGHVRGIEQRIGASGTMIALRRVKSWR
jgi:hypothetical protein